MVLVCLYVLPTNLKFYIIGVTCKMMMVSLEIFCIPGLDFHRGHWDRCPRSWPWCPVQCSHRHSDILIEVPFALQEWNSRLVSLHPPPPLSIAMHVNLQYIFSVPPPPPLAVGSHFFTQVPPTPLFESQDPHLTAVCTGVHVYTMIHCIFSYRTHWAVRTCSLH